MERRRFLGLAGIGLSTALSGCAVGGDRVGETDHDAGIHGETLTLTTTTSTYDTGLLDELNLAFETRYGVAVDAVAQGTGAALETARRGDADAVLVHARSLEDEFLREGYGVNRRDLMFNDFVVVGPETDPAGIDGSTDVRTAFRAIADGESTFVSRGDDSGTYRAELDIWEAAGVEPGGEWYREAGASMGEVLNQADMSDAYALADRGTFLSMRSTLDLGIRVDGPIDGGPELLANPYGIMAVNPGIHSTVDYDLAMSYIGFVTSPQGQSIVADYTVDGERLFFPDAVSDNPNFEQYVPDGWSDTED